MSTLYVIIVMEMAQIHDYKQWARTKGGKPTKVMTLWALYFVYLL